MTTPTLDSLKPLNGGLEASWTNSSPYDNIFDAFLLVVKDHDNSTIKINLSEGEALEESYAILNLDNNFAYSVTYNQVNLDSNGGVNGIYSSNTLTATPSIPPLAPVIVDIYYHDASNAKVKFTLPSGTSAKDYKSISFNKFNDNSNTFLGIIQTVDLSGAKPGAIYETTITDLSLGEIYAVSSFLKNECGYGALSNTFTFKQIGNAIHTPTLNYVESGLDSKINVNFTVPAYSNASPMNYHIEYKEDVQDVWTNVIGEIKSYTGSQMVMTVEVDGLTNLKNYQVKVKCFEIDPLTAVYNDSLYSDIEKGVPMLMPTFSLNPELSVIRNEDGLPTGFKSTWDYTETQGGLLNVNVVSSATYTTDASGTLTYPLSQISALNLNQVVSVDDLTLATDISLAAHLRGSVPPANLEYFTYTTQQVDVSLGNPYYNVPPPQNAIGFVDAIPLIPTNLTYIAGQTSTSSTSGVIQIFFEEGANNNEVKTQYICNLYTSDPSINTTATPLKSQTVTEENATFKNLDVNNYYWVSVTATNYVGSSTPATTLRIVIPQVVVPTVTNASTKVANNVIELTWDPVENPSDYTYTINLINENGSTSVLYQDISGSLSSKTTNQSYVSNATFGIQTKNSDGVYSTNVIVSYTYQFAPTISTVTTSTTDGVSSFTVTADNNQSDITTVVIIAAPSDSEVSPVNVIDVASTDNINTIGKQTFNLSYQMEDNSTFYVLVMNSIGSDMYESS